MQYIAAAAAIMAAGVSAQSGLANGVGAGNAQATAYDTVVVNAYVTTCPGNVPLTSFTYNGQAYTASANQVVTVTNCPCTVTAPAGSIPSGALTATAPNVAAVTPAPGAPGAPAAPAVNNNAAAGAASPSGGVGAGAGAGAGAAAGVGSNGTAGAGSPTPEQFTGAASKLSGAGLAAVFALAAYAL